MNFSVLHVFSVSSALEIMICNGHFSWKQQEKTGEEEVFSSTGELTNITLPVKKVRSSL